MMLQPSTSALDWHLSSSSSSRNTIEDIDINGTVCPSSLTLPPVANPAAYTTRHFDVYKGDLDGEHKITFAKGTTTLAFKFQGGIIVSVDSRSTQGPYIGKYQR
jgi:hypothetical protein